MLLRLPGINVFHPGETLSAECHRVGCEVRGLVVGVFHQPLQGSQVPTVNLKKEKRHFVFGTDAIFSIAADFRDIFAKGVVEKERFALFECNKLCFFTSTYCRICTVNDYKLQKVYVFFR